MKQRKNPMSISARKTEVTSFGEHRLRHSKAEAEKAFRTVYKYSEAEAEKAISTVYKYSGFLFLLETQ